MVLCFIFRGAHKRQAGQVCRHLLFLRPEGAAKMLVGEAPQTRQLRDKVSQSFIVCGPSLTLLCLMPAPLGGAVEVVEVAFGGGQLPHILLGRPVLGIEGLPLFGQLPPPLFQHVHLWQLDPAQKLVHGGLGRPVVGKLRLMLRQIFFGIPGRLVAIEHGPGLGVLHHGGHERGGFGQLVLRCFQFSGQRVKTGRSLVHLRG